MKKVIIESPYAGRYYFPHGPEWFQSIIIFFMEIMLTWRNKKYARECMKHSLNMGEAPFLSHLLYTQVLNDNNPDERYLGIYARFEWGEHADLIAVYIDYGISEGMRKGIEAAEKIGKSIVYRNIK